MKRKRRTKAEIEADRSKGLGDTIEKITEATGIKKAVKAIFGDDCGCDERKEMLNKLFPYSGKKECLTEEDYTYLTSGILQKATYKPSDQSILLAILNKTTGKKYEPTTCGDCWRERISELKKIVKLYEEDNTSDDTTK